MASIGNLNLMLTLGTKGFTGPLSLAQSALSKFAVGVQGIGGSMIGGSGLTGVMIGLGEATRQLGMNAIKAAADWETMAISFGALTGSAALGEATLNKIANIAAATPFEFKDMASSVQRMMATGFGAEESIDMLVKLGNVAAAAPGGMGEGLGRITLALSQMKSKGKIAFQEMNQLAEAGIPAWDSLARRMGLSVEEAMHKVEFGRVSSDIGIAAVLGLADDSRFAGLMDKQSQTLMGTLSTLKDNAQLAMRDFGRVLIEGMDLKGGVNQLAALLGQVRAGIDSWRPSLVVAGGAFTALKDTAFVAISGMLDNFKMLAGDGSNLEDRIKAVRMATLDFAEQAGVAVLGFADTFRVAFGWAQRFFNLLDGAGTLILGDGAALNQHLIASAEATRGRDAADRLRQRLIGAGMGEGLTTHLFDANASANLETYTGRFRSLMQAAREFQGVAAQWQAGGLTGPFADSAGVVGGFGFIAAMKANGPADLRALGADLAESFDLGFVGELAGKFKGGNLFRDIFKDFANPKLFEETRTPFELFEMKLASIEAMGLSAALRVRAVAAAFDDLSKTTEGSGGGLAEGLQKGTAAAESAIIKFQNKEKGAKDPAQILQQALEVHKRQLERMTEIANKIAPPKIIKAGS